MLLIGAGLLAAWLVDRIPDGSVDRIGALFESREETATTPSERVPTKGSSVCDNRFKRLLAGFSVRRQEFMPFVDDDDAVEVCWKQLDETNPDHWAIAATLELQRARPDFRRAAALFATACAIGSRIGCVWSAVWPTDGPYPVIAAADVLRLLEPYLDGTLPVADTTAALALLYGSPRTPEGDARAEALLKRAAAAGDRWAAQELAAFTRRR